MKRFIDILISLSVLLLVTPVFLVLIILIKFKLGSPILFVQSRPGLHCRIFKIMKFRTMLDAKGKSGRVLPDHERMTKFGAFIRSTSLDELPSLINVIKGDMSLVGPRPLLIQYLTLYTKEQSRRHDVRPGITGWAQVNGRNAISWEDKFKLDLWYVDNKGVWLDLKILFLTIKKVLVREGISANDHVTIEPFKGSKSD